MEKDIEELKAKMGNKVDCLLFDEEIDRLKHLINAIGAKDGDIKPIIPTGPSISSKELNDIRDALKKVAEHEEKLKGFNA
jgi:methyl-accepting chemotaxis protein